MSAKGIGNPACPHSYPPLWQGTPKVVVSSGGALYQPVTMVTSQGQVVTQAIPQGAIQLQNTQVSVCVQCRCVRMCMGLGEGNRDALLPARHFTPVTPYILISPLRSIITPT